MKVLQNQETLAKIVSLALGGEKKKPDKVVNASNVNELEAEMRSMQYGR